ncbi:MAG: glycosyltransferase family 4 protein [Cyclobacteriaceae bacterium]|nr:glycosyltransferase family 4 protein [Cyclobacteriaceae bacterium]
MRKPKLLRITTVSASLHLLLKGQFGFMREHGFDVLTASADGPEITEVKKEGIDHVIIPFTRKVTPFQDAYCIWKLVGMMSRFKPDIVHTHTPKAGLLGMLTAFLLRIPVRMHTVAGLPYMEKTGVLRWVLRVTDRATCWMATKVYPNSEAMSRILVNDLGIPISKLSMIAKGSSNGIDGKYFDTSPALRQEALALKERLGISPDEMVFSFAGRIVRDKGMVELAEAFKTFCIRRKARLLVLGNFEQDLDPLPPDTYHFLQNDSRVILAGFQSDVRPWLLASDMFVFPSYREGFPNVVMQACCLEVPVIASDINGCNEIIAHETTGWLVKPKSTDALVEAMTSLSENPDLRKQLSKEARQFVTTHFDQQYIWQQLLSEYQRQLSLCTQPL